MSEERRGEGRTMKALEIVDEMRDYMDALEVNGYSPVVQKDVFLGFVSDLEAAIKQERQLLDANVALVRELEGLLGGAADCLLGAAIQQKRNEVNSIGNTAALRDALKKVTTWADSGEGESEFGCEDCVHDREEMARAALDEPARNCDVFATLKDAREAFQKMRGHRVWGDVELWDDRDEIGEFFRWLFAAAEKGGEA